MALLYEWKTDFSGNDTNTPQDETAINGTLGTNAREIKSQVRKDLSRFDNGGSPSVGKDYVLYKSGTDFKVRDHITTDKIAPSFKVSGNWVSVFAGGTRFAFCSSYANLEKKNNGGVVTASSIVSYDDEVYTQVFYSSDIEKINWTSSGTKTMSLPLRGGGGDDEEFKITCTGTIPSVFKKGAKVVTVNSGATGRASLFTGDGAGMSDPESSRTYISSVNTAVVKSVDTSSSPKKIVFYRWGREFLKDMDGLTDAEATSFFPTDVDLSFTQPITGWGFSSNLAIESNVSFCTGDLSITVDADGVSSDFVLVGAQSGISDLNSSQYREITVQAQVSGKIDNGGEHVVNFSSKFWPVPNVLGGQDPRIIVQCIDVQDPGNVIIRDDVYHPVVKMNEWFTGASGVYSGAVSKRSLASLILSYPSGMPEGVTATYDITIFMPVYNGATYYKPA